jgi:hypothetical protein
MNSQKILLFRDAAETLTISVHFEEGTKTKNTISPITLWEGGIN